MTNKTLQLADALRNTVKMYEQVHAHADIIEKLGIAEQTTHELEQAIEKKKQTIKRLELRTKEAEEAYEAAKTLTAETAQQEAEKVVEAAKAEAYRYIEDARKKAAAIKESAVAEGEKTRQLAAAEAETAKEMTKKAEADQAMAKAEMRKVVRAQRDFDQQLAEAKAKYAELLK